MPGDDSEDYEVFTLIADENRLAIVRALAEAPAEGDSTALSFPALRDRVGMRDSGQFNYHLENLVCQFAQETDEGYRLRFPGSLLSGPSSRGSSRAGRPSSRSTRTRVASTAAPPSWRSHGDEDCASPGQLRAVPASPGQPRSAPASPGRPSAEWGYDPSEPGKTRT
jgi:hypothetical protein